MDKIDYITKNANLCTAKTEDSTKRKKIPNQSNKIPSNFKRQMTKKTNNEQRNYICRSYYKGIVSLIYKQLLQVSKWKKKKKEGREKEREERRGGRKGNPLKPADRPG